MQCRLWAGHRLTRPARTLITATGRLMAMSDELKHNRVSELASGETAAVCLQIPACTLTNAAAP